MEPHQKALDRAKIRLMEREDTLFYTYVFFSLNQVWDDTIPTACTDGKTISFNPGFFMQWSPEQQLGLILHETEHVALQHMARGLDLDHKKWNFACDYVINIGLMDRGFTLPDGGLVDPQYRGMSAEQVYALLPDPPPDYTMDIQMVGGEPGNQEGQGKGAATKLQEEINDILVRAAIHVQLAGKDMGNIPAEIRARISQLTNPTLPWYQLLRRYCNQMVKTDYSFRKPNRRYFPDMHLPSRSGDGLGHVAAILDMSGSVTDAQSTHFASEAFGIFKALKPKLMSLVQFDTVIKSVTPITAASDMAKVTYHGRGGTNIAPVIEWIKKERPSVAVIFTDGHFHKYHSDPKIPVIWVIHGNRSFTAPFGKVIHYDIKQR